jgi:SM-20-related protein
MMHLNIETLRRAKLRSDPFEYTIVPGFLSRGILGSVIETYPEIPQGGSYPLESLDLPAALQQVIEEMNGPEFERAIEKKFDVELAGLPKMHSLRGHCRMSDGKIHTDSKDKVITVLLYLNENWDHEGGKLRLLRNGADLEDYAEEVPPDDGTMLVFRRSDKSFHGHGPFEGVRRSIQMNWMASENSRAFHKLRHKISARVKKLVAAR